MTFLPTPYELVSLATGSRRLDKGGVILDFPEEAPSLIRTDYGRKKIQIREERNDLYRFADWLPICRYLEGSAMPITYKSKGLAETLNLENLWITFNGWWPEKNARMKSGTFKECEAFTVCARIGDDFDKTLMVASAGNTARAFARVCSENAIPLLLFVPQDNLEALWFDRPIDPCVKLICPEKGGDYFDAIRFCDVVANSSNRFVNEGGAKNVARRDGMACSVLSAVSTIGRIPDVYFQAVGSGTGAIAAWEAGERFRKDGRWGKAPMRLMLSQNKPFTPMCASWAQRSRNLIIPDDALARKQINAVQAKVLTNRRPPWAIIGGVFDALESSGGDVLAISNEEAAHAGALFEELEGMDIADAASVAVASLVMALEEGRIKKEETIMLNITGGGMERFKKEHTLHSLKPSVLLPLGAGKNDVIASLKILD